ncbi:contractile injection system tape measure protein [Algoriphagus terrigena]|uniref:contractile injection system tape measure protein n=1 Tax=Algoriphagus terrigena TaxID=344884 RepID=UPI000686FB38|nr:contractile injection system tape measure protein [Algoriphagus terrigena]
MDNRHSHQVDDLVFSFAYSTRPQASRCNTKLQQLMAHDVLPELEKSFAEVAFGGLSLEFDRLEIDLGSLSEEDISEDLGEKIRPLLVEALKREIRERILGEPGYVLSTGVSQRQDFSLLALKAFFLQGYFPAWADSTLNLYSLLDFLIASRSTGIGELVREVSLKSESARKRIAFLKAPYFDQLIEVLVPGDAEWIMGYRESYLDLHRRERQLTDSAENMQHALNLFILTFVIHNVGPKFNRLSFSDSLLKSIAAHYNLDFLEFLRQITEILHQNTIENQLFRDFKEAIIWVGEKNNIEVQDEYSDFATSARDVIGWLNHPTEDDAITRYIQEWANTGMLFCELSSRFPGFWKSLSKQGLTQLISLMGGDAKREWLELTYTYLAWHSRRAKSGVTDQEATVKDLFDLAQQGSSKGEYLLFDLESWFSTVARHGFAHFGSTTEITRELLAMGLGAGVFQASLTLIRAKKYLNVKVKGESAGFSDQKYRDVISVTANPSSPINDDSIAGEDWPKGFSNEMASLSEWALAAYLSSGSLPSSFRELSKSDLQGTIARLIKSQNPVLLNLIRNSSRLGDFDLQKRWEGLFDQVSEGEMRDYVQKFAGPMTLRLLAWNEYLKKVLGSDLATSGYLDREIWKRFLEEVSHENRSGKAEKSLILIHAVERYLAAVMRMSSVSPKASNRIRELQKLLNSEKSVLIELVATNAAGRFSASVIARIAGAKTAFLQQIGLLRLPSRKLTAVLKSLNPQYMSRLRPAAFGVAFDQMVRLLGQDSLLKKLQTGLVKLTEKEVSQGMNLDNLAELQKMLQTSTSELESKAEEVIRQDLARLAKAVFSDTSRTSRKTELQESIRRILVFSRSKPELLLQFLRRNRHQLPTILVQVYQHTTPGNWRIFTTWLRHKKPTEFKMPECVVYPTTEGTKDIFDFVEEISRGKSIPSRRWIDVRLLSDSSKLDKGHAKETLQKIVPVTDALSGEITVLLTLPSGFFAKKSVLQLWRKTVLISAYQYQLAGNFGQSGSAGSFWAIFLKALKSNRSAFRPEMMDWQTLIQSSRLESSTRQMLRRFVQTSYLREPRRYSYSVNTERLSSVVGYWKEEGFLPWWTPIKSKIKLLSVLLFSIEHVEKSEAFLLVSALTDGNAAKLIQDFDAKQLKKLLRRLSSSKYKRHFASLILEGRRNLAELENRGQIETRLADDQEFFDSIYSLDPQTLSGSKLERWIKKQINSSVEGEVVRSWFGYDPRIQGQLEALLSWSRFLHFGNLSPGKWKLWVLRFALDFYVSKRNSFSEAFLGHFLRHLSRSQAGVNWKVVFHRLLGNKEFAKQCEPQVRDEIKQLFPERSKKEILEPTTGDLVKIGNAGLVLCWPFLSVLFSRLKLSQGGVIPVESQSKAVMLLQYLVFGHTDFPEYELVLNKVLIGMKTSQHLEAGELSQEEKDMVVSLLHGMKGNWEKMKNASVDAIRETFLQRQGTLEFGAASNILRVPKTGVDVLLDSISWNISVVKLPWMEKSLEVKWR